MQPGWSPTSFKCARCLLGSRHYDACGPGGGPELGSREQSTGAQVDHCILSHCRATWRKFTCSHRVSSWEIQTQRLTGGLALHEGVEGLPQQSPRGCSERSNSGERLP